MSTSRTNTAALEIRKKKLIHKYNYAHKINYRFQFMLLLTLSNQLYHGMALLENQL